MKIIVLIALVVNLGFASLLQEKIKSFIGPQAYDLQRNLIRVIFKPEENFLKHNGEVDDIKVLKELKQTGLLQLFYKEPRYLSITFEADKNPLIFMRVINESLNAMGYNYFLTNRVSKKQDHFVWQIDLKTEHVIDPTDFSERLRERGCFIKRIEKPAQEAWSYVINTDDIRVGARQIEPNTTVELFRPMKPYWVEVDGAQSISLRSSLADRWHPSVVFFDEALHVIKDYRNENVRNTLKIKVPQDARYVKISDIYTLDNIKRGLSIYLRDRND